MVTALDLFPTLDEQAERNIAAVQQPARAFFAPASEQWSESYLARVVIGPGPGFDAERAECDRAAFEASAAKGGRS